MADVFISYAEEDSKIALGLARGLEDVGYTTWYFERDGRIPGPLYVERIPEEITKSQAILLIISPRALGSQQVFNEVVTASEAGKPFVPILIGITHTEFQSRNPKWRHPLGAATSLRLEAGKEPDAEVLRLITAGLETLGCVPGAKPLHSQASIDLPQKPDIPHNLLSRSEFVGRKHERERVHQALQSRSKVISIEGIGGVGKTALALETAYECLDASKGLASSGQLATFEGFIWTTAGDQKELVLDELLDQIARTLDQPSIMKQPLEEKRESVRRLLQKKPYLLIIDSFEAVTDENVVEFLEKVVPEPSKVLITTREQRLDEVHSIPLRGLPDPDALALIRSQGKSRDLEEVERADDAVLLRLCRATGGIPLAMKWALGQMKGQSLETVLEAISGARGDIFEDIFARSWNLLLPDARRVLRTIPIFESDALSEAIEVASDVYEAEFEEALEQLVEMSLLEVTDNRDLAERRYSLHPMTRAFASVRLADQPKAECYARKHLADFFSTFTRKHGGLWNRKGFARLAPDFANITSVIRWCWREKSVKLDVEVQRQLVELGIEIFDNIRYFVINYGFWNLGLELGQEATRLVSFEVGIPSRLEEWQFKVVRFRIWPVAWILRFRGDFDAAESEISQALKVFEHVGDKHNTAYAKRHLALVLQLQEEKMEEAERLLREAHAFAKSDGDTYRTQLIEADLAELALKQGNFDEAWKLSRCVLDDPGQITDKQSIARFYRFLGCVARQRGDSRQAKQFFEQALEYVEQLEYQDGIADTLFELAQLELEMGQKQAAREKAERARQLYRNLGISYRVRELEVIFTGLESDETNR